MMRPRPNPLLDAEDRDEQLIQKYNLESIARTNLIPYVRPLLQRGWTMGLDGKLTAGQALAVDTPWVFAHQDKNRTCDIWHKIFFNVLDFLPSDCLGCWKVVVRPKNLKDLFLLREIQEKLGRPSKCGIEVRPTVCGLYGGYFYNDTLHDGEYCWSIVKQEVDRYLEPDTPVILKRGCTEFEAKFGDSRKWEEKISNDQLQIEQALVELIPEKVNPPQLDMIKPDVMKRWIEWAYQNGDMTYKLFTNGKPVYEPYAIYHENIDPSRFLGADEGASPVAETKSLDFLDAVVEDALDQANPEQVEALRKKLFGLANRTRSKKEKTDPGAETAAFKPFQQDEQ